MTDVPHFALPFQFATPQAAVVEQDTIEDVVACCTAILTCPRGYRVELPDFGLPDPTFQTPGVDLDAIAETLDAWEPRASNVITEHPDVLDELVRHVQVSVRVRSED